MERRFDVFVSHSSVDKPWVLRLVADLERYGVSVWVDENEIRPGDLFVNALERGLEQSHAVAFVISPESMGSGWVGEEYHRTLALAQRKAHPLQLIPILLRTAELPGFLASRNWLDFRDPGQYAENVWRLVWGITGAKPPRMLDLDVSALPPLPREHLPEPAPLPPGSRMPMGKNELFVGRAAQLRVVAQALQVGGTAATGQVTVVTGLGGIGKTQIAAEFVHRYGQFFAGGVFWLDFADPASVRAEIAQCGGPEHLGLWSVDSAPDIDTQLSMIRRIFAGPEQRLLVFDHCEDEELLAEWRPKTGGSRVLVTSRRSTFSAHLGVRTLHLDVLPRAESMALLYALAPGQTYDAAGEAALDAICAELGDLPLALHLAGSFLARYATVVTPAAYLAELRSTASLGHGSLQGDGAGTSPTGHVLHVGRTFALSWERLDPANELDAMARKLLQRAACLAPGEPIPHALLAATLGVPEDTHAARMQAQALRRLLDLGLLDPPEPGTYRIHRLVADFARHTDDHTAARAAVEQALLDEARRVNDAGYPARLLPWQSHLRAVTDAARAREDEQAADLCEALGYHLYTIGNYYGARSYCEHALAIREKHLGPEHPDAARSLNNLALLLQAQGALAEARPLLEQALAIDEKQLRPDHPDTAKSLNNLAALLQAQGALAEARPLYERALAIRQKQLGPEHPDTAKSLNDLAKLLHAQGDLAEARPLYEKALAIWETQLGPDHPDTAQGLNNLASLLKEQGALGEARPLIERALSIREKHLGPEHPDTAQSLNNLAVLLYAQGDLAGARPLYERALATRERYLGPEHPDTATSLNNLAALLQAQGDLAEARPRYERALAIWETQLGPDHPRTAQSRNNLAWLLRPRQREVRRETPRYLKVVCVPADEIFWHKLTEHLGPLLHDVRAVTEVTLLPSVSAEDESSRVSNLTDAIAGADIAVFLISADFLRSPYAAPEALDAALRDAGQFDIAVLTVVARPCLWTETPFARYSVLPHGGRTIATASDQNEVLREIAEGITTVLHGSPIDIIDALPDGSRSPSESNQNGGPSDVVEACDVFRTTSTPTHTLVETPEISALRVEMNVPGRLLVVEGPSGIGKTVAVKHALDWVITNGHRRWASTYLNVKDARDVERIDALLQQPTAELRGYTIIDDFHDLDPERKRRLGRHAKALADRDGQAAKLIFVGIPRMHESIAHDVRDLGSRMSITRIRRVDVAHIRELIEKGERALNVGFVHRARLAVGAQGSFVIAQRLCEAAVGLANVWQTLRMRIQLDYDVPQLLPAVLRSLQAELHPQVQAFAMQDHQAEVRGAALALLWHLREADDGSLQISYVRPRYPELKDAFDLLLRNFAEPSGDVDWRSLFYCDPAGGQIAIEDPKLHFYLKHLAWEQLGRDCGVDLCVLPDNGQLGFVRRQRTSASIQRSPSPVSHATRGHAEQKAAAGPVVRVLHLSDFHFQQSTKWDADTMLGRLAMDIARLGSEGRGPDLIVLTGDIAYSGKAEEYDLARTWITKELLPAARLEVERLVIVPGNHDADRSRVDFAAQHLGKGIRDERNQQRIKEVLDGTVGSLLLGRLEAFMAFVNDLGAAGAPLVRPWYQAIFEFEGMTLHCAAMASSWLSADDSDYGRLLLGLRQCNEVLGGADRANVVLVALHHPWDYVAEWDRRSSLAEIERSAGLILRGHLHEERHDYHASPRHGGVLELAAGACYESSEYPSSYHLIELWPHAPQERRARVQVRYWNPARRDWGPDLNTFGNLWGELPLRVRT